MTNPYQNTRSPFLPDPIGLSGSQRRTSYASVASGVAPSHDFTRAGAFSHILHPTDGGAAAADGNQHYNSSTRYQSTSMTESSGPQDVVAVGGAGLYQTRNQQLPSFSRSFEMFMSRGAPAPLESGLHGTGPKTFFVPSYLQGSGYMAKLEEAHKKKLQAQKEAAQNTQGPSGAGLPSSGSNISLHTSKLPPPSYRGMTHDVIEKPPVLEDDVSISPLPARWNKDDKFAGLDVLSNGLEVKVTGVRPERESEAASIRASHPMPVQCGLYYFEIQILSRKHNETMICIGFSAKTVSLARAPGWEPDSWGYHGDDGLSYAAQNHGKAYSEPFSTGDTIGCGVNFRTGVVFFTKNGKNLGPAFWNVKGNNLYPSVGLKNTGEHIRANFGQTPFLFDIDGHMKKEIQELKTDISKADTSKLAPPLKETELIQQLVLQFLQHDGYIETARAFAEEVQSEKRSLSIDPNEVIEGINITDDEDANKRQKIRRAVLEGDIDKALKYTNVYYPEVLKDNERVNFRLRCRKFIEMIRREAEMNIVDEKLGTGNGHSSSLPNEDIDMDETLPGYDKMDTEDSGLPHDLTLDTLRYGQELRAEFSGDQPREVTKVLDEIFSLMAYQNPLKEKEVAHLLDRKGRVAVAEELNSAILQHFGKSSRSALENLYAQTSVLLEDLSENGGPGAFVSLQGIIDDIPKTQPF